MRSQADRIHIEKFNQTVGRVLMKMREEKAVRRRAVVRIFPGLTGSKLRKYERGQESPPACLFFELVQHYEARIFDVESAIFEAGLHLRRAIVSDRQKKI